MSNRDFKEGIVAGAKPFGDKLDQLADVVEEVAEDLREGVEDFNNVKDIVNIVLDDFSAQDKKRIYDLDQITDISSLEDDEKEFLVASHIAQTQKSAREQYIFELPEPMPPQVKDRQMPPFHRSLRKQSVWKNRSDHGRI